MINSNNAQAEAGLYIDLGTFEGALIGAWARGVDTEVVVTVARSSPALRGAVWFLLATGLVVGALAGYAIAAGVGLLLGALAGCVGMVAALRPLGRSSLLARGRSDELADQLARIVKTHLANRAA